MSIRAKALELYTPPFRYDHGYIMDSQGYMVSDEGGIGKTEPNTRSTIIQRIRGWGRIGYFPSPDKLQDEVGEIMAQALNEFWAAHAVQVIAEPGEPNGTRNS